VNEPQPYGGASNSTFHHLEAMSRSVTGGNLIMEDAQPGASWGRLLNTGFKRGTLVEGAHELVLECVEAGRFGFDYIWIRKY